MQLLQRFLFKRFYWHVKVEKIGDTYSSRVTSLRDKKRIDLLNKNVLFWHSRPNFAKIIGNDSRVLRNEELVTPLHVDKSPYTRSYSSKSSGVSGSFTRKRRAESNCVADIDGTTKDVILSDPSELHNSWLCTSELCDESDSPGIFVSINLF